MSTPPPRFRTAFVTGGSRGLGRATVAELMAGGTATWTVTRRQRSVERLRHDLPGLHVFQGDLGQRGTAARIARRLARDQVTLDLVVHNAGLLGPRVPLAQWSRKQFDQVMAVNLSATHDISRRLLPRCHSTTLMIFITSGVTQGVRSGWGAYQISKVALENLAATYAKEWGDSGPRVVIFDPGAMRTDMRHAAYPDEDPATLRPPEHVAAAMLRLASRDDLVSGNRYRMPEPG